MAMPPPNNHRPESDYFPSNKRHIFSRILLIFIPILMLGSLIYFANRPNDPNKTGSSLTEKDLLIQKVVLNTIKIKKEILNNAIDEVGALEGFNLIEGKALKLSLFENTEIYEDSKIQEIKSNQEVLVTNGILIDNKAYDLVVYFSTSTNELIVIGESDEHIYVNEQTLK